MMTQMASRKIPLVSGIHNDADTTAIWRMHDFDNAYRKGRWNRILSKLRRKQNSLRSLPDLLGDCTLNHQSDQGLRIVPVDEIVASVGRNQDFDQNFMPRYEHIKNRWDGINRAYYLGVPLPPVELIQVDDQYAVVDGHHRISVARAHGQTYVDAHVVQMETACIETK